jgi:hypothetical protein
LSLRENVFGAKHIRRGRGPRFCRGGVGAWTLAALALLLACAGAGISPSAAAASGMSFTYLDPAFTQSLYGTGSSGQFFGGVAFAPNGDPVVDHCENGAGGLDRFDHTTLLASIEGTATLHPISAESSGAGCGLTNHPDGALYSNTSAGVIELDANTGAVVAGPFGAPGKALGITTDPLTKNLVYVESDGTLGVVDPALTTAGTFSAATSGDFIDQIAFDPTGQYLFLSDRTHDALTVLRRDGSLAQTVPLAEGRSEPDGIAFHSAAPQFVVTNDTDGTLSRFEFPGNDYTATPAQSLMASGGFRGDNLNVGADTCMYLTQAGTRYDNGNTGPENSLVRVCPGFQPPSIGLAPYNTATPAVTGSARVGETLTCAPGSWGGDGPQSYTYTWRRDGVAVAGRSSQTTYVVGFADAGHALECEVTASNEVGSSMARSALLRVPGPPVQQVVFVHGIRSDCQEIGNSGQSYAGLYDGLQIDELPIYTFCYDHDNAFEGPGSHPDGMHPPLGPARCFSDTSRGGPVYRQAVPSFLDTRAQETAPAGWNGPLPVTGGAADRNDGDSALAYDAAKLDDCISALVQWDVKTFGHPLSIAVVANSMGGAITRGWLQLAKQRAAAGLSSSLAGATTVVFLQGAIEGSWLAKVGEGADVGLNLGPDPLGLAHDIDSWARDLATKNDLDPTRAGVKDLVPGSAWYRSIASAGPPPPLHYYTFSTNIRLDFYWEFLWWTKPGPSTDFLGDGLMQLGDPAFNALPQWGGSEFLLGAGLDQQQWTVEVTLTAPLTINGIAAIIDGVMHQPYAHFNFGSQIGHLQVPSCGPGHGPLAIPQELARIFNQPDNSCTPVGTASRAGAATARIRRTPVRGRLGRANSAVLVRPGEVAFIDRTDQATLTIFRGPRRGGDRFELSLPSAAGLTGTLPGSFLRGRRGAHSVRFRGRATQGAQSVALRLRGTIDPARHLARLAISAGGARYQFITATPNGRAARAADRRVLGALKANAIATLVTFMPAQLLSGESRGQAVAGLLAQGVRITSIKAIGRGRLGWLANGAPAFSQRIIATAQTPQGRSTRRATLTLIEEAGRWKLLSAA